MIERMVRRTDPPASVAAARQAAPKAASVRARVLELVREWPNASARQLGGEYAFRYLTLGNWRDGYALIQRRLSELERDGLIVRTGERRHGRLKYGTYEALPVPQPPLKHRTARHCNTCRCLTGNVSEQQLRFA